MEPTHPQVRISHGGFEADVDEGIKDLILACWRSGIETDNSCQGGLKENAYVSFLTPADAVTFLAKVLPDENDVLYNEAIHQWGDDETVFWEWKVFPLDLSWTWNDEDEMEHEGEPFFALNIHVRFPPARIPLLTERLAAE